MIVLGHGAFTACLGKSSKIEATEAAEATEAMRCETFASFCPKYLFLGPLTIPVRTPEMQLVWGKAEK